MQTKKLKELGSLVTYPKDFILVKAGSPSKKLWLIEKGLARYIYYHDDKELTGWIDQEGDIVGSVFSLLGFGAARETIQLLEESDLYEVTLEDLKKDSVFFDMFKNQMLEHYFMELENRIKFFQSLGGKERYEFLLANKPDLVQRVPQKILSTYLGITPESLSRIRASLS
ncbi:MAG: Crp/Fnr family transcriptional regulator [Cyclobacteriaceae bacterium]|nr:Crp/Fnr family transcriptional regulator [Cyclobacteriaceae bacterium]